MTVKITATFRDILDAGRWEDFCEKRGINPWCIAEGLADGEEQVVLTFEEADRYGLIPKKKETWYD